MLHIIIINTVKKKKNSIIHKQYNLLDYYKISGQILSRSKDDFE